MSSNSSLWKWNVCGTRTCVRPKHTLLLIIIICPLRFVRVNVSYWVRLTTETNNDIFIFNLMTIRSFPCSGFFTFRVLRCVYLYRFFSFRALAASRTILSYVTIPSDPLPPASRLHLPTSFSIFQDIFFGFFYGTVRSNKFLSTCLARRILLLLIAFSVFDFW